jgi:hypothetical protein
VHANVPPVRCVRIARGRYRGAHGLDPAGKERLELFTRKAMLARMRRIADQIKIGRMGLHLLFGDTPIFPHLLVQELRFQIAVQQQDAVRDIVERVA